MPSTHSAAAILVHQERLFNSLSSFRELEQRIQALHAENTKAVGDAFEIFIEAYLATQVALQADKVWLVGQVPPQVRQQLNLPADAKGIDGVFQTHSGELVPYQVKFRTERGTLNFTEVAPFLAITERARDRVLFTNAKALASDAANRDALRVVRRADFHQLSETELRAIEAWLKELPPPRPALVPRPHQAEAIEQITAALTAENRTTAVMACGSGKTLVALWVAEAIKPKSVLVLVPSLSLLSQTLREWCRANPWGAGFNVLCVCSDPTVSKGTDEIVLHKTETPFRIDTDPQVVRDFLSSDFGGVLVVFSTYQSVRVVADGARGLPAFDMGIFDEAHKTTGPHGGTFAYALNDNNLPIDKRLFLTATPRHYDINRRDREGDFKIVSMDDEAVYGNISYKLPFAEAARREIICSYKILISVITTDELNAYLLDHGITLVDGDQIGVRWVANQIALKRAIDQTDVSKIITFHSRVQTAQAFVEATPHGIGRHISGFSVLHVNGEQAASVRDDTLDAFRNAAKALIANARCLTEGVDVPAVDMVAFIDPRKSRVDIAQAAGRAMRKAPNKTVGYVVVPLFLEQAKGQSIEDALERSDVAEVANVVNAMREQDDLLIDIIRELRESRGRGEVFNPRRLRDWVEVIGPTISLDAIAAAVDVQLIERLGISWDEMIGRLVAYKQEHGDCRVSPSYIDKQLAAWVKVQRQSYKRGKLEPARIQRLDEQGFDWDPFGGSWEEMFGRLAEYKQQHGGCAVPDSYSDKPLVQWVHIQRTSKNKGNLEPAREQRLDELGFVWDARDDSWAEMFGRLTEYQQQHGDCLVPRNCSDKQLVLWVGVQRTVKKRGKLNSTRERLLDELGFVWDARDESWDMMFGKLTEYQQQHGDSLVPRHYSDRELARWVNVQRTFKRRGKLESARVQRLKQLGFVWNTYGQSWEEMFSRLVAYKQQHGDCAVPDSYSDKTLANWIHNQRMLKKRGKLEPARVQRLEGIGFIWDSLDDYWENMFGRLVVYRQQYGDCLVPRGYSDKQLATWVTTQRVVKNKGKLEASRIQRLDELGFVCNPNEEYWDQMFSRLVAYKQRYGDCLVPQSYSDKKLATWVGVQRTRRKRGTLDVATVQRLDELGFVWDALALIHKDWEEMFYKLVAYHKQNGDCRVPQKYSDKKLAHWVMTQRRFKIRGKLDPARVQRFEELGFVWDARDAFWDEMFRRLAEYKQQQGNCLVPPSYSDKQLVTWVKHQRMFKKRGKLDAVREQQLDALDFIWDPIGESWDEMFGRLVAYKQQHGNCLVPRAYGDKQLAHWVNNQRVGKNRGTLEAARVQRLDVLGFAWTVRV